MMRAITTSQTNFIEVLLLIIDKLQITQCLLLSCFLYSSYNLEFYTVN